MLENLKKITEKSALQSRFLQVIFNVCILYSSFITKKQRMNKNSIKSTLNNYLKQKNYPVSIVKAQKLIRCHRKFTEN